MGKFADRIDEARAKLKPRPTNRQIARESGISVTPTTFQRWYKNSRDGKGEPAIRSEDQIRLAEYLGIDIAFLVHADDKEVGTIMDRAGNAAAITQIRIMMVKLRTNVDVLEQLVEELTP